MMRTRPISYSKGTVIAEEAIPAENLVFLTEGTVFPGVSALAAADDAAVAIQVEGSQAVASARSSAELAPAASAC